MTAATKTATCRCGQPVRGAYLCRKCQTVLRDDLAALPGLVRDLEITAYRMDRVNDRSGGRGSGERPLPYRPRIIPILVRVERLAARGLDARWIAHNNPGAAEQAVAISEVIAEARSVIDLPEMPRYLGACEDCGRGMYAERSADVFACRCGRTYSVSRRVTELQKRSRDVVAPPSTIATALTSLDQPVTEERIRKWKERGRLTPRSHNGPRRQPWYRVGDVQDLLVADARRTADRVAKRRDTRAG